MLKVIIAGRLGRNAEHRRTQDGTDICSFAVASDVGWGDNKRTIWVDVAKFGKGAEGLTKYLHKGDAVTVVGDLSTREHEGKTYLNCRADEVTLQGGSKQSTDSGQSGGNTPSGGGSGGYDDLDDSVPF